MVKISREKALGKAFVTAYVKLMNTEGLKGPTISRVISNFKALTELHKTKDQIVELEFLSIKDDNGLLKYLTPFDLIALAELVTGEPA